MKWVFIFLTFMFSLQNAGHAQEISREKFRDLSCSNLNAKDLFSHLREDFSKTEFHLPIKNYSFNFGILSLANCWSLAHLQRLYFYLHENALQSPHILADTIRGFSLVESPKGHWQNVPVEPQVLDDYGSDSWNSLLRGYVQTGSAGTRVRRTIQSETEAYQISRFHDLRNIKFLTGPIPLTPEENNSSFALLKKMLEHHLLPMVVLRPHYLSQHVVVVKKILDNHIFVYDSNTPSIESEFYFNQQNGFYYAPQIVRGLPMVTNEFSPVGVFVVDSGDLSAIKQALYTHLKKQCREY